MPSTRRGHGPVSAYLELDGGRYASFPCPSCAIDHPRLLRMNGIRCGAPATPHLNSFARAPAVPSLPTWSGEMDMFRFPSLLNVVDCAVALFEFSRPVRQQQGS